MAEIVKVIKTDTGYSDTPLVKKLGIKAGFSIKPVMYPIITSNCLPSCPLIDF